jgi:hypothetical protein
MLEHIRQVPGEKLDRPTYHAQMTQETARLTGIAWKVERHQSFTESDDDLAWQAFIAGDWEASIAIFDNERTDAQSEAEKYTKRGSELRRLRIVESPVTPYVQWEMQSFKVLDKCGLPIRVLDSHQVKYLEADHPLPELIVVGQQVLFEIRYNKHWAACGARRIEDRQVIAAARTEIAHLWDRAEPLNEYFQREIAPLPPPVFGE